MSVKVIVRVAPVFTWPELRISQDLLEVVDLFVDLLKPASLGAFLLAAWRFTADLGWASDFWIADGVLSHWQIWAALGISMLAGESYLSRRMARR